MPRGTDRETCQAAVFVLPAGQRESTTTIGGEKGPAAAQKDLNAGRM